MSGWVIYRFRSTRCLTLSQFFEKRYSRKFRIFTGIVAFTAGLINFGIFPAVGAQFFMQFCGLPENAFGLPVFPLVMILLLSIALYFVYSGGQIAVIIADFFQGIFAMFVLLIVVLYLFFTVSWDQVSEALEQTPIKLAQEEIVQLQTNETFLNMDEADRKIKVDQIN